MKVLVTGASAGIGGAICRRLAQDARRDGRKIQIAAAEYKKTTANDALKAELEAMGAEVITPYGNLSIRMRQRRWSRRRSRHSAAFPPSSPTPAP